MKNKKIILICHTLSVGGAERHISSLGNCLVDHGVQVKILLLDNPLVSFPVDKHIEIVYLGKDNADTKNNLSNITFFPYNDVKISQLEKVKLKLLRCFNKKLAKVEDLKIFLYKQYAASIYEYILKNPDWLVMSFMSFCNVSTMMALKSLPNKVIFSEFTAPDLEFAPNHPMNTLKRQFYPRANGAVFQTPDERDFYQYLHCPKFVIPNPLYGNYPKRFVGIRRKEIVTFARIHKVKNLPLLIDACQELFKKYPEYILSIYGDGEEKQQLIDYTNRKGLSSKVIFHDFDIALHEKIKDCAMYVSTSDREGISNSMLEAMAIGLPTICTDCPAGGARMMITPYENGILIPCRNQEALVKAMTEVIDNTDLAEKMSKNSIKIRERLSVDKIIQMWVAALDEVER